MRLTDFIFSCYNTGVLPILFFGGSHIYAGSLLNSILFPYDRVKQAPIFIAFVFPLHDLFPRHVFLMTFVNQLVFFGREKERRW